MAKESDIISTIAQKDATGKKIKKSFLEIDTQKYIDMDKVKGLKDKISNFEAKSIGKEFDEFLKEMIKLKRGAIVKNIGLCIAALGVAVPVVMVSVRKLNPENKEFQVKKEIEEKMKQHLV